MDCRDCVRHVRDAISSVEGISDCDVYLTSERAVVRGALSDSAVLEEVRSAVRAAGYDLVSGSGDKKLAHARSAARRVMLVLAAVSVFVLLVVILGEWMGLLDRVTDRIPWYASLAVIVWIGRGPLQQVLRSALHGRVVSHTLMTVGALAAMIAGEWATAAIVVTFMRVGAYTEGITTDKSRRALRELSAMAPRTARRLGADGEELVAADRVVVGDLVLVRPGEAIPVDGTVVSGHAFVNQAAVTGESEPTEALAGSELFAASLVSGGALTLRATAVGIDTTFGTVLRLVEQAEGNRSQVQRVADRFSGYYLPVVAAVAAATWLISGSLQATIAVMVVACSCSFALATPIAMLSSICSLARHGVLIKGGRHIESLTRVSVLLIDKTGTITTGTPRVTDVIATEASALAEQRLLRLAAAVERDSEHPLAEAVRRAAFERGLAYEGATDFVAHPGLGVYATVAGARVMVGRPDLRLLRSSPGLSASARSLMGEGKSVLMVLCDGRPLGLLATADSVRPGIHHALQRVRACGVSHIELISGDNRGAVRRIAAELGIDYQAELLPQDKIALVRQYQSDGRRVAMIGDGVNDAPALAGADVGIAMAAAGSDVAIEAAHVALMNDDWNSVPLLFAVARRTMRVVFLNIGFTALYNLAGLSLAALGLLPPVVAAAAQSMPDLGILANSSRLLRLRVPSTCVNESDIGEAPDSGSPTAAGRIAHRGRL
ncbi:MAG: cation-translocating P-type ATPase [Spirochaetaceae bacterium]|nr:MAG: cation-translocating P-type ATPase [Spirochaetaceae bacterium]